MAQTLDSLESQEEIDSYLDQEYQLPVRISPLAPLPRDNRHYEPLHALVRTGFRFTLRTLLHAVGCKSSALPLSNEDLCLRAAHFLLVALDLGEHHLCFRADIDSDFRAPLSHAMGVGVVCLIASDHLGFPWDQLGPIPGRGKRFDYRARSRDRSGILEAKGTQYRNNQESQIKDGLAKKAAHHAAGERYDFELIVSTHVGGRHNQPRILLADPPSDDLEWEFSPQGDNFYRLRHYVRALQFAGAPDLARLLYLESNDPRQQELRRYDRAYQHTRTPQARVRIGDDDYVGTFFKSAVPEHGHRYAHLRERRVRRAPIDPRLTLFQGLRASRFDTIRSGEVESLELDADTAMPILYSIARVDTGERASIFTDGTAFFVTLNPLGDRAGTYMPGSP